MRLGIVRFRSLAVAVTSFALWLGCGSEAVNGVGGGASSSGAGPVDGGAPPWGGSPAHGGTGGAQTGGMEAGGGGSDPTGDAASPTRVVRGGNLLEEGAKLVTTTRAGAFPGTAHVSIGFRCALDIGAPPMAAPAPPTSASAKSGPAPSASAKASPPTRGAK